MKTLAGITVVSIGLILSSTLINIEGNVVEKDNVISVNIEKTKEPINETIILEEVEDKGIIIELEVDSRIETDKFINTKKNYNEKITKYSNMYGIDPRIMLAIATQESGRHYIKLSESAIGLMQIEKNIWINKEITAYNFLENIYNKEKITEDKLKDIDFNIKVACMYMQKCLIDSNYDINIAIQMYNYGYGNIEKTFQIYHKNNKLTLKESLKNYNNDWLNCREYINVGDKEYLEHIVSYIEDLEKITCKKQSGEELIYSYMINEYKPKI